MRFHFTPTYSSWLNQVELWFAKIERDLLARGIFTSVADLARKIRRYIHRYNKAPKPIRWAYRNPARRIGSTFSEYGRLADQAVPDNIEHHVRRIGCPQGLRLAHQPAEIDAHRHDERLQ